MLTLNKIFATTLLMIAVNACSPQDSSSSATESYGSSDGSKKNSAAKSNSVYTEASYILGDKVIISCTSTIDGFKAEKSTKAGCDALKKDHLADSDSQMNCSYDYYGTITKKNSPVDCAMAEAEFSKKADIDTAKHKAEFGNE